MALGVRTFRTMSGEIPAMLPIHPSTSVAVNTAIAVRGSTSHLPIAVKISSQLSCDTRGVFATMRVASQDGASYTGNDFPHATTSVIPASRSEHAGQDWR